MSSQERWYSDPDRGLPTIRQASTINDYPTQDEVKLLMAGKMIEDDCPLCGQPLPLDNGEGDEGGYEHDQ